MLLTDSDQIWQSGQSTPEWPTLNMGARGIRMTHMVCELCADTHFSVYVKCSSLMSDFNQKWHMVVNFTISQNSCLADLDLLHTDRWAGKHGETNTFFQPVTLNVYIKILLHSHYFLNLCQTVIYLIRTYATIYVWDTQALKWFLYVISARYNENLWILKITFISRLHCTW